MESVGQVFADSCLICSQQCFIHSHSSKPNSASPTATPAAGENKLSATRKKRSSNGPTPLEIRQTLYKAFEIGISPEDVSTSTRIKGSTLDLPLCGSCIFKVGQLKSIQSELTHLERQYEKIREEIAFSIVDVVASNMSNPVCTNIGNQPAPIILKKLKEYEVGTLQQLVFEKWHEASYTDFDDDEDRASPTELPSSTHQNQHPTTTMGEGTSKSRTDSRKSSTSSKSGVTTSTAIPGKNPTAPPASSTAGKDRPSSISITKIESRGLAYENGQLQILDVDEDELEEEEEEESYDGISIESPPIPEEYLIDDDDFEEEEEDAAGEESDPLGFPFGLELAEYSSSLQNGNLIYEGDDGEEEMENEQKRQPEAQQNLEIFRDKDGLYECEFCQKKFIHKYPFRDHLRVHFGDGPRCKICNKIFPKKHNLMLHLRTHSGEKPYVCTVCDKGFADKSNLKVHMRVHTGERPYKCEYCNVAFSNSSRLVVHKRTHTGEKPFTCDICNRKCTTRNQLSTHRKTHFQSGRNRIGGGGGRRK